LIDAGPADTGPVQCDVMPTYSSLYTNIFGSGRCAVGGCHAGVFSGGLDMGMGKDMALSVLVNADTFCQSPCTTAKTGFPKRVVPMSSATSFLYEKLASANPANGAGGSQMPLGSRLMDCEIAAIKTWIDDGAMNN